MVRESECLKEKKKKLKVKFEYKPENGEKKVLKEIYANKATDKTSELDQIVKKRAETREAALLTGQGAKKRKERDGMFKYIARDQLERQKINETMRTVGDRVFVDIDAKKRYKLSAMRGTLTPVITMSREIKDMIDELMRNGNEIGDIRTTEVKVPKSIKQEKGK